MLRSVIFVFSLVFITCHEQIKASEAALLTFQQLYTLAGFSDDELSEIKIPPEFESFHGKTVRIRGFLYRTPGHEMILAAEPDLKHCCIGSRSLIHRQIALPSDFHGSAVEGYVVLLEGKFFVAPLKSLEGVLQRLYLLNDARVVEEDTGRSEVLQGMIFIGIFGILCLFFWYSKFLFSHQLPQSQ